MQVKRSQGTEHKTYSDTVKQNFYDKVLSENRVEFTNCNFGLKYASIASFRKSVYISML